MLNPCQYVILMVRTVAAGSPSVRTQPGDALAVGALVLRGARLRLGRETILSFKLDNWVKTPISMTIQTAWSET